MQYFNSIKALIEARRTPLIKYNKIIFLIAKYI